MIVGIEGSFRLEMGWIHLPSHKDFMLCNFSDVKQLDMKMLMHYSYKQTYWV